MDAYLEQAAAEVAARIGERKTLVFTPLIATSERFVDCLRQEGVTARHIDGNSPDRREILANFTEGGFQVLSNASLLLEGYDEPSIGCIVPLRPTNNRSLYAQMVGRGTRIAPGKNDLLLLDFAWLADRHNLCKPASLIARDANHAARIGEHLEAGGDLLEAVEAEQQDRESTLRARIEVGQGRKERTINPLHLAIALGDNQLAEYEPVMCWHYRPVTDKQAAALKRWGVDIESVQDRGYASHILNRLISRKDNGLCTPKQAMVLTRFGYHASDTSFDDAKKLIKELASNGWQRPD